MKTRLSKSLCAALLAAIIACNTTVMANTITGAYETDGYIKITDSLNIGNGSTPTSFVVTGKDGGEAFVIAGDNAVVTVNQATITLPNDGQLGIGDGGNGTMIITNNSTVDLTHAGTIYMGYKSHGVLTVEDNSTLLGAFNNFWLYGDSTVNVQGNSKLVACTSDNNLYNYRVLLGIKSEDTTNTTTINVGAGSQFISNATQFVTNYSSDTTININVEGAGAKLIQTAETANTGYYPMGYTGEWVWKEEGVDIPYGTGDGQNGKNWQTDGKRDSGWYDIESTAGTWVSTGHGPTVTYLCDSGTDKNGYKYAARNNCTTNISATLGGEVLFDSVITYVGSFLDKQAGYTDKRANLTIGEGSSISFNRMEIYADTNIKGEGTFKATNITLHDGAILTSSLKGAGKFIADTLTVKNGAELKITFDTESTPATTFSLSEAAQASTAVAILDTDLILESGAVLTLEGSNIDLNGHVLTILDGAIINTDDLTAIDENGVLTVFSNFSSYSQPDVVTVTINGQRTELTYDGTSIKTTIVPEPTTATLSLLALAGLAARRRRR